MNELFSVVNEILSFPELLINKMTFLPEYLSMALLKTIYFVPILIILYYIVGLLEKYFLRNIRKFINFLRTFRALFAAIIGIIPQCTYSLLTSIFYSRNMITRGTLFAGLIMCSDEALPLLFLEPSKAFVIFPLLGIKFVFALAVAFVVDFVETLINLRVKHKDDLNTMNMDINEYACCHHTLSTEERCPNTIKHAFVHTVNIFMFVLISLTIFYFLIQCYGTAQNLADVMFINSPLPILIIAALGLIPNCAVSVLIGVVYVLGLISFPAFLAGMFTVTGLGLNYIYKHSKSSVSYITTIILYIAGVAAGFMVYYNIFGLGAITEVFIK